MKETDKSAGRRDFILWAAYPEEIARSLTLVKVISFLQSSFAEEIRFFEGASSMTEPYTILRYSRIDSAILGVLQCVAVCYNCVAVCCRQD